MGAVILAREVVGAVGVGERKCDSDSVLELETGRKVGDGGVSRRFLFPCACLVPLRMEVLRFRAACTRTRT